MNFKTTHHRKYERMTGLLFIIATIAYSTGSSGIAQVLSSHNLTSLQLIPYSLLVFVNSIAICLIGFMFFGLYGHMAPRLFKGYLLSRLIEGLLLLIGTILTLTPMVYNSLEPLYYQDLFFNLGMIVLGAYSTYFFYRLLRLSVGPKWLMGLGSIGYIALTIYSILSLVPTLTVSMLLFIPGGIFELLLPLYLIFKGLKQNT